MSPEQGHGRDTDARSDIYSMGIIFYEMLMQRKPYVAGTPMQVIYKHAHSPLPELKAELKRFEELLYNCIAKDPKRRYCERGPAARCGERTRARRNGALGRGRALDAVRRWSRAGGVPRSLEGPTPGARGTPPGTRTAPRQAHTGQGMSCGPESSHRMTFASSCHAPRTMRVRARPPTRSDARPDDACGRGS